MPLMPITIGLQRLQRTGHHLENGVDLRILLQELHHHALGVGLLVVADAGAENLNAGNSAGSRARVRGWSVRPGYLR
jgi:hypothetical protein